ncbi:MAG TPA: glycosyltransferase [Bryobacteraceae bacterium]|nr:glycosyltransferase [Bryobacteraceae bacterium]
MTVADRVEILASSVRRGPAPVFSICVPQYNRTSFLIEACRALAAQSFSSFELCISDDRSTDGRQDELISFLESSGLDFVYARQMANRRYDGNLRGAMALARGRYSILMGNDDRLARPDTLEMIDRILRASGPVQVAVANYAECESGRVFQRVPRTGILGSGPSAAAQSFRNFSFVSGVIFETEAARRWATEKWDGSEMYQMFIGCRMLAAGGTLLGIGEVCVEKDIRIANESVDSYASKKKEKKDLAPVVLPMAQIVPLVADAIAPFVTPKELEATVMKIWPRLLLFTYGFWLVELRRVHSWRYSASVYRGLSPARIGRGLHLSAANRARIRALYAMVGAAGLLVPVRLFRALEPALYRVAKRT